MASKFDVYSVLGYRRLLVAEAKSDCCMVTHGRWHVKRAPISNLTTLSNSFCAAIAQIHSATLEACWYK